MMCSFRQFFLFFSLVATFLVGHFPKYADSANILFFIAMGSLSHRTSIEPLAHKLVDDGGHNVTFFTPLSPTLKNPKFTEFSPKELTKFYKENIEDSFGDEFFLERLNDKYANSGPNPRLMEGIEQVVCSAAFNSPEFKPWVEKSQFDLVIIDHSANKCGYAIAYKFGAPTIVNIPTGPWAHEEDQFGIPFSDVSWLPNYASTNVFTYERTLYDKLYVILYRIYSMLHTNWIALPKIDELVRKVLEMPDMPPIEELEKNTSLIFINQHFSMDYPRSLPPHMIQVGGMHCDRKNRKKLPQNLQNFIDGAGDHGFVLVSFGTLISMSKMPHDLLNSLFDSVKKTKTRFLWKWEGEPPTNLPSNVLTANWFPQQDLLASKSIRAFITHGGMMSTYQGVCHGVPMIVVPVAFDQPYNGQLVQHHGIGFHVELTELKEKFDHALTSILNDKRYTENAKIVSGRVNDRPLSPLDTAYYWTNYVLKHRDVSYMRPVSNLKQTWWQRRLLDVWAFLFTVIIVLIWSFYKIVTFSLKSWLDRGKVASLKTKMS